MPREKENMAAEIKRKRLKELNRMIRKFGSSIQNLASDFDSVESPEKKSARRTVISKRSMTKTDPSSRKKKQSQSTRRGNIGKLSASKGGAPEIDKNSHRIALLGVGVEKYFTDEETGVPRLFSGRVTEFDARHDLYKVRYEDGDEEEVYSCELEEMLESKMKVPTVHHDTNMEKNKKKKRSKNKKTHSVLEKVC